MLRSLCAFTLLVLGVGGCAAGAHAPDFALRNDSGQTWRLSGERGKLVLLTFGFTHCADTCPTTLAKLVRVTQTLGAASKEVEIVFITVDPRRDTTTVLHRFIARFSQPSGGRLLALTGTPAQIAAVEDAYHVWSARTAVTAHGYDVAHSATIIFIDADGRLRAWQDDDASQAALTRDLRKLLG